MRYLFSLVFLISFSAKAQWKDFIIGAKGDTLNRVDAKGMKQGPWVIKVREVRGEKGFEEEGYFVNDKKEGRWVRYSLEGDKLAVENYRWGQKDGRCEYYNNVEDLLRVESWKATDPKNPYDTVRIADPKDPTKTLRYEVIKVENATVRHGTWRFYDPATGKVEKTEKWVMDRLKTKEDEEENTATAAATTENNNATATKKEEKKKLPKPKEVVEFEKKNAGKKKVRVRDGNTGR